MIQNLNDKEKQGRTPKQKILYDFIKKFQEENGISPSYIEMQKITKTELSTVFVRINSLEKKGWIRVPLYLRKGD